jgi:DNA mismatch repair protein MutS2
MNQLGIPVPLRAESSLPIFDQVFVDMGDAQSISASLSTFAAHMMNVAFLESRATENSLILLDELGSSTDPEQGLSLAQSLLEDLISRRSLVAVSTHFSYLKYLGYTQAGAVNASLNINEETLMPTYQIRMGVPGESFAFPLARRQGLRESVVARAEQLYRSSETEGRTFMEKLRQREQELATKSEQLDSELVSLSHQKEKVRMKENSLKELEQDLLEREIRQESSFLGEARKTLEKLQQSLVQSARSKEEWQGTKKQIHDWEGHLQNKREKLSSLEKESPLPLVLEQGMVVRLKKQGSKGILLTKDKRGAWNVQVGSFKLWVEERDLEPLEQDKKKRGSPTASAYYSPSSVPSEERAKLSLDVRGFRLEEALKALQVQLDRALIQGLLKFSIIHGMGNGVLQAGIHKMLLSYPHVERVYLADAGEGGAGKTWVELKSH